MRLLSRARPFLPLTTRRLLVDALVVPHYCDILYDGCTTAGRKIIQGSQNYAAKSLLGMRKFDSATEARQKLGWIDLEDRRKLHLGVFLHKASKGHTSAHATEMFKHRLATHSHNTRSKVAGHMNSTTHSTSLYEKSVFARGRKVWNSIPVTFKECTKTKSFKDALQKFYLDKTLPLHHRNRRR